MTRIFISYRREDCPAHAGRLCDTLNTRFGDDNVFMDVDTIDLGVDFVDRIDQAIGDCDVVLALIGDEWLTVKDRDGKRRIDRADDFVRLEISTALKRDDVRVIPVLVEGAQMPSATELPDALVSLARRNGISLTDTQWRSDTSVLIGAIERVMANGTAAAGTPAPVASSRQRRASAGSATADHDTAGKLLWMVPALFSVGGLSLIFAGWRVQERKWTIAGLLYMVAVLAGFIWTGLHPEDHPLDGIFIGSWLLAWVASGFHLFAIRPEYLAKAAGGKLIPS